LVAIASRFGDFLADIIRHGGKENPMAYVEFRRSEIVNNRRPFFSLFRKAESLCDTGWKPMLHCFSDCRAISPSHPEASALHQE
jgi:hypothetical protein